MGARLCRPRRDGVPCAPYPGAANGAGGVAGGYEADPSGVVLAGAKQSGISCMHEMRARSAVEGRSVASAACDVTMSVQSETFFLPGYWR